MEKKFQKYIHFNRISNFGKRWILIDYLLKVQEASNTVLTHSEGGEHGRAISWFQKFPCSDSGMGSGTEHGQLSRGGWDTASRELKKPAPAACRRP